MADVSGYIAKAREMREIAAEQVEKVFRDLSLPLSEADFARILSGHFANHGDLYESGWYNPPPGGIAALFAPENDPKRLWYDNLRNEKFWPRSDRYFQQNSLGMVFCCPFDEGTACIGDFGLTIYNGSDIKIREHLKKCLAVMETVAEAAQVGMEFKQLHSIAQTLFKTNGLTNSSMTTLTDSSGNNIGHTIPFTDEPPQDYESSIIHSVNFESVRDLVNEKRIFINPVEEFKIHENVAFTVEARLEDPSDPSMPNTFFHLLVTFENGKRTITENFHYIFEALGMEKWIKSKY